MLSLRLVKHFKIKRLSDFSGGFFVIKIIGRGVVFCYKCSYKVYMSDKLTKRTTAAAVSANAGPDPIDTHVGARLKARRILAGFSQEKLAEALGVTFQQVQKYENGANRVGASRLFNIGEVLGVGVGYFFEGYGSGPLLSVAEEQSTLGEKLGMTTDSLSAPESIPVDILSRKETLDLIKAYYAIEDKTLRVKVLEMVKGFGG